MLYSLNSNKEQYLLSLDEPLLFEIIQLERNCKKRNVMHPHHTIIRQSPREKGLTREKLKQKN